MGIEDQVTWLRELRRILAEAPAIRDVKRRERAGYEHEFEGDDWRRPAPSVVTPLTTRVHKLRRSLATYRVTQKWDDAKRAQNRMEIRADGTVAGPDRNVHFSMDADSLETYTFRGMHGGHRALTAEERRKIADGARELRELDAEYRAELEEVCGIGEEEREKLEAWQLATDNTERRGEVQAVVEELAKAEEDCAGIFARLVEAERDPAEVAFELSYLAKSIRSVEPKVGKTEVDQAIHHSSPVEGRDVAGAGDLTIEKQRIVRIANASGHYKPQFEHLLQTIEIYLEKGALLDKEVVQSGPDGKAVPLDPASPEYTLYERVRALLPKVSGMRKVVADGAEELERIRVGASEEDEDVLAELERGLRAAQAEIRALGEAMNVLAKRGIGPRNRVRGDVQIEFLSIDKDATGAQVHGELRPETFSLEEFVQTAGGTTVEREGEAESIRDARREMFAQVREVGADGAELKHVDPARAREDGYVPDTTRRMATRQALDVEADDRLGETLRAMRERLASGDLPEIRAALQRQGEGWEQEFERVLTQKRGQLDELEARIEKERVLPTAADFRRILGDIGDAAERWDSFLADARERAAAAEANAEESGEGGAVEEYTLYQPDGEGAYESEGESSGEEDAY